MLLAVLHPVIWKEATSSPSKPQALRSRLLENLARHYTAAAASGSWLVNVLESSSKTEVRQAPMARDRAPAENARREPYQGVERKSCHRAAGDVNIHQRLGGHSAQAGTAKSIEPHQRHTKAPTSSRVRKTYPLYPFAGSHTLKKWRQIAEHSDVEAI